PMLRMQPLVRRARRNRKRTNAIAQTQITWSLHGLLHLQNYLVSTHNASWLGRESSDDGGGHCERIAADMKTYAVEIRDLGSKKWFRISEGLR
ncbi:hypothetical protein, partial [Staphylococcus aureus]|uniref:hypothetical protein n=1 Tax=Staphylococcus aureus TaxID=1280 RepID=UPI0039BE6DBB